MTVVVEWNGLRRYLDLPAIPDAGDTLIIPSAQAGDPEQLPRPVKAEEQQFTAYWNAAGWQGAL